MNLLRSIFQVLAGLVVLLVPFVLIYWVLQTLNLEPLEVLKNLLGSAFEPFLGVIRASTGNMTTVFQGLTVDFVPIIFCGLLLLLSVILTLISRFIGYVNSSLNYVSAKTQAHVSQRQREQEKKALEDIMMEKTAGYVVVRYNPHTTSSAYLISSGLSQDDIKEMFMDHFNKYNYHDARLQKESTENSYIIVFDDVPSTLIYCLALQENISKVNQELSKSGVKLHITSGIHCTSPLDDKETAIGITNKVCNLAAPGDITVSKLVKDIFEKDRAEHTLNFISRGVYDLGGEEVEIFTVKRF